MPSSLLKFHSKVNFLYKVGKEQTNILLHDIPHSYLYDTYIIYIEIYNTFVKIEYEQRIKEKRKIALFNGKTVDLDNAEQKLKVIE